MQEAAQRCDISDLSPYFNAVVSYVFLGNFARDICAQAAKIDPLAHS